MPNYQSGGGDFLPLAGGTLTGDLNIGLNSLILNNGVYGSRIRGTPNLANSIQIRNMSDTTAGNLVLGGVSLIYDIIMAATKTVDGVDISEINQLSFVDRGDPASYDFDEGDLTTNGNWFDLNLASYIPVGTKLVLLRVRIFVSGSDMSIWFKEKGNSNLMNKAGITNQGANETERADIWVVPDANRKIQYNAANGSWNTIEICVAGWLI